MSKNIIFLYGVLADKEYSNMSKLLLSIAKKIFTITPNSPRALPARELALYIQGLGGDAMACKSAKEGVEAALATASADDIVCAIGSLYIIEDVRKVMKAL
jgi:dihydrofolate synthase/folylpolyglutamate synthase